MGDWCTGIENKKGPGLRYSTSKQPLAVRASSRNLGPIVWATSLQCGRGSEGWRQPGGVDPRVRPPRQNRGDLEGTGRVWAAPVAVPMLPPDGGNRLRKLHTLYPVWLIRWFYKSVVAGWLLL